ncbi:MFS general substrate transporter [Amniculicola lignicola CBS 123094]|uniref:MFS general substrate transporter n=1 Tax=Amniculicola lignicola CBS 123094 TaxID=1392246 RepID=A0A6A5WDD8_9PLEO|nr:MFS general substrate transporter [Amniculicola lignicola CBS 123094]
MSTQTLTESVHSDAQVDVEKCEATIETQPPDPNVVDWDGPEDPENPMNWPTSRKVVAIGIVSAIMFLSPLASTIVAPAAANIMATFGSTNETLGAFITSIYLLGYTFGPLVIAPLSELYGRAPLYNICNVLFVIFNIACAVASSLNSLIAFRFLAGIAASSPQTLGGGTIADLVPVEKRGLAMVGWILGPVLGPSCGPLIGAYLAEGKGWRWIFWVVTIVGGAVAVLTFLTMSETYGYVILQRKTQRLQKQTGNMKLRSRLESTRTPRDLFTSSIIRPLKMLFFSPIVFLLSLYMATIYGFLYLMFTTFSRVFEGQYGFSTKSVGLVFLGSGVGSIVGLFFTAAVSDRLLAYLTKRNGGVAKPEFRIPPMILGAFLVPVGLFLYGWTAEKKAHWFLPILGTGFLGAGMFVVLMPGMVYFVDAFTTYAASAAAASSVFRSLLGALLPLAGDSMYNALGVGWANSVLGFISVAMLPIPVLFWMYGERIRESKMFQVRF